MNRSGCHLEHRQKSTSSSRSNKKNPLCATFLQRYWRKNKISNKSSIDTDPVDIFRPTDRPWHGLPSFEISSLCCKPLPKYNGFNVWFKKKKIICLLLGALDFRAGSRLSNTHTPYSYERIVLKLCTTARNGLLWVTWSFHVPAPRCPSVIHRYPKCRLSPVWSWQ